MENMRVIYNKQSQKFFLIKLSGETTPTEIIFLNRNRMSSSIINDIMSFANSNNITNLAIDGPFNLYQKTNEDNTKDTWVYFTEPASMVLRRSLDKDKV